MHDKHTIYHRGIDKHLPTNARTHNSQSNEDLHQAHNLPHKCWQTNARIHNSQSHASIQTALHQAHNLPQRCRQTQQTNARKHNSQSKAFTQKGPHQAHNHQKITDKGKKIWFPYTHL